MDLDFIVLDFETTGLRNEDTIIEIGYVWIRGDKIKKSSSTLVNPQRLISPRITEITGISNKMIANSPTISELIEPFAKFLRGKMIVAHNASFDMRFLNNALRSHNLECIDEYICTMKMFRAYKKAKNIDYGGAKLSDLTAFFGLTNDRAHRALEDAEVTAKAFIRMSDAIDWKKFVNNKK